MGRSISNGRGAIRSKQVIAQSNNAYTRNNTISAVDPDRTVLYQAATSTSFQGGQRRIHSALTSPTNVQSSGAGYAQPTGGTAFNWTEIIEYN